MQKRNKKLEQPENIIEDVMTKTPVEEKLAINDMPLNSLGDYIRYNTEARKLNKKLRVCRYPIKPCPIELHPTEKIIFGRNDQPSNPLPVFLSNHLIDFKMTLEPGKTYDLPRCVIEYISSKGTSRWKWFEKADGSKETRVSFKEPRFSLRTIYEG